jgi:hypothetical protein
MTAAAQLALAPATGADPLFNPVAHHRLRTDTDCSTSGGQFKRRGCAQLDAETVAMEYISVVWKHSSTSDPVRLVSELDEERYERRKLEFFADGTVGAAGDDFEDARTQLGIVAVPALSEINEDAQFQGRPLRKASLTNSGSRTPLHSRTDVELCNAAARQHDFARRLRSMSHRAPPRSPGTGARGLVGGQCIDAGRGTRLRVSLERLSGATCGCASAERRFVGTRRLLTSACAPPLTHIRPAIDSSTPAGRDCRPRWSACREEVVLVQDWQVASIWMPIDCWVASGRFPVQLLGGSSLAWWAPSWPSEPPRVSRRLQLWRMEP